MRKISIINAFLILVLFLAVRLIEPLASFIDVPLISVQAWIYSIQLFIITLLMAPIIKRHIQRFNTSKKQNLFYLILGVILFILILGFGRWLSIDFPLVINESIIKSGIGNLLLYLFSCILLSILEILVYKALTDRLSISYAEGPIIILSGLLFFLFNVIAFMPLSITMFPSYALTLIPLGCIIAYLYNQTTTLIIPQISLVIAILLFNCALLVL